MMTNNVLRIAADLKVYNDEGSPEIRTNSDKDLFEIIWSEYEEDVHIHDISLNVNHTRSNMSKDFWVSIKNYHTLDWAKDVLIRWLQDNPEYVDIDLSGCDFL